MSMPDRSAGAHFAVREEGVVHPLCKSWRSNWNWTLEQDRVTCPQCRAALQPGERAAGDPADGRNR